MMRLPRGKPSNCQRLATPAMARDRETWAGETLPMDMATRKGPRRSVSEWMSDQEASTWRS